MWTDWLFHWMTLPAGLAAIALAIGLPFLIWRLLLGGAFRGIGFKPLAVGYAFAALGMLVVVFASSQVEFNSRVADGLLVESQRAPTVAAWVLHTSVLLLLPVLPLLGLVGTPLAAWLLKHGRLSVAAICVVVVAAWFALAILGWSLSANDPERGRLEVLFIWITALAPGVLLVGLAFFAGIYLAARPHRVEPGQLKNPDTSSSSTG